MMERWTSLSTLVRTLLPFGIVGLLSWSIWLVRRALSHRARPSTADHTTTTSVVVPIFHEDPEVLVECLETWLTAEPDELLLVVDTEDAACRALLAERDRRTGCR